MLSRSHFLVRHFSCCCFPQGWLVTVSLVWWLRAYRYKSVSRYVRLYYLLKCVGEFGMSYMQLRESCCNQRWGVSMRLFPEETVAANTNNVVTEYMVLGCHFTSTYTDALHRPTVTMYAPLLRGHARLLG